MPIANYSTTSTTNRSLELITNLLLKAGVQSINSTYAPDRVLVGLEFSIDTEFGIRDYRLPVRVYGVMATLKRDNVPPRYQTMEHASRVAWKIAHDWLRAQLALIDAGMTSLPEIMLPYALTGHGDATIWESWVDRAGAIEA